MVHCVFVLVSNCSLVRELLRKSGMILRPITRACPTLIPRLFLVKNLFKVARKDLSKDFIRIEAIGAVGKLTF